MSFFVVIALSIGSYDAFPKMYKSLLTGTCRKIGDIV